MERRHQVRPEPHLVRDLLHEPDVAIETIDVRTLVCRTALPAIALKLIYFAEVPPFGKDQPGPFLRRGVQVLLARDKLETIRHSAPMQAGVLPLAVPGHGIRMSRRIHVTSVLVKRHPIDAVRFCESCHIYCITYTNV